MKKCLIVSTVSRQFTLFERGNIQVLKSLGYEVHCAANFSDENPALDELGIIKHPIDIQRSPYSLRNIKAYKQLNQIIKEGDYNLIHCHSPMGGVLTRLAARKTRKNGTKVFYTAHGFHFYKGAPIKNWLMYYPVEKWLSKYTDTLITINKEDYSIAKNKFKAKRIEFVNGIGVDESKFNFEMTDQEKEDLRKELGLSKNDFVMIYPAELSYRKNQGMLIECVAELVKTNPNVKLLLPG
ncbi:MAG: glycosyltransferase, partial [Clostridia bacterium]|nr:glycosyltransferase [Clostridia bacterium]